MRQNTKYRPAGGGLQQLDEPKKQTLFDLMYTYIRDAKARKAYA
jgi:hypothetical protein